MSFDFTFVFSMEFLYTTYTTMLYYFSEYCYYIQFMMALLVLWLSFKKSEKPVNCYTTKWEDALAEWIPEPLVDKNCDDSSNLCTKIVDKKIGKYIHVNGIKCLNLSSYNFLGYLENEKAEQFGIEAVRKYGIGSCGPRGFYGTVDVHLKLEEEIANFLGFEEAIVYSYGFSTIASAIPAYAKRSDVIFADENVNFAIQKGLDASRSEIIYFEHNNVNNLTSILEEWTVREAKDRRKSKKMKKFLVVEGIYNKSGDICPLVDLIKLKNKYKLRLFIDESISLGTLGENGRGVTEYFNVPVKDVDLIIGSMEHVLASVGGFCAGSSFIVEHQRLAGLGYCFSASLPPMLTVVAITNLNELRNNKGLIKKLNEICEIFHRYLNMSEKISKFFYIKGDLISPIKHLVPKSFDPETIIKYVVDFCEIRGIAFCSATYLDEDRPPRDPSIRVSVMATLDEEDIKLAVHTLEDAIDNFLDNHCTMPAEEEKL